MRTLLMIATLIFAAKFAEAHDIYSGLKDVSGHFSCCDEADCRPAHYKATAAGVEMFLDGEWVRVPNELIQYRSLDGDTGETRGGHWCGLMYPAVERPQHPDYPPFHLLPRFYTRCVVLPPGLF